LSTYDVGPVDGLHPEIGLLIATLHDSTREWREYLERPSREAIVFQPWPRAYSIGALILHVIDCELGWFENFIAGKPPQKADAELLLSETTLQDEVIWPVPPAEEIDWYFELQDRYRVRSLAALVGQDPERVIQRGSFSASVRWVVAHVVEHDAYHGGQAVLLHEMWKATAAT